MTEVVTPRPLRVARIIARLNVGGPTRHVVWLTEAMNSAEFETILITGKVPPGEDDMTTFAHERGVTPMVIPEMSREISLLDIVAVWKVFQLFRRFQPDIVHTHTAKAGTVGRLAGCLFRFLTPGSLLGRPRQVRFVHTFHGHVFHSYYGPLKTLLFLAIERILARVTDRILVLSPQQLHEIHDKFRIGLRKQFSILRLGIDLNEFGSSRDSAASLREELRIPGGAIVVGIVGRLTAVKNHKMFLNAAAELGRQTTTQIRFVIYGDGEERKPLEAMTIALNLNSISFAGTRAPANIYASMDVAALTSLNEGTPLTLIEAMASELPVVSTAVGGVIDLLGEVQSRVHLGAASYEIRERGLTVASNDPISFAAATTALAEDPALRELLGKRGRDFVERWHSKDRLVADVIALYHDMIQQQGN